MIKQNDMKEVTKYRNKKYTQQDARKMDAELDIVHKLLGEVYNDDNWANKVKDMLDRISRLDNYKLRRKTK